MDPELEIKKLKEEGFDPVYVWDAEPGEEDSDHSHDFETHLMILEGSIEIGIDGGTIVLLPNNEINIPKGKIHSGKAGRTGCKYIVAEKH